MSAKTRRPGAGRSRAAQQPNSSRQMRTPHLPSRQPATDAWVAPRTRALALVLTVMLVAFGIRLVWVQGIDASQQAQRALAQRSIQEVIPAMRGTIFDSRGVKLAESLEARVIAADQTAVPKYKRRDSSGKLVTVGVAGAVAALAPLLKLSDTELTKNLTGVDRYVVLARGVSSPTWTAIKRLHIPGISSSAESKRSYPQGSTASALIGLVSADGAPLTGLEQMLNSTLQGKGGQTSIEIGQDGNPLPDGITDVQQAVRGKDVQLTLDSDLQWYAQNALRKKIKQTQALSGTVVVQQVKTGKLLALASYPTFEPAKPTSGTTLSNLAFTDVFEPGSTAKIMTVAAALQEKKATPTTRIVVPKSLRRADVNFKDSHEHETWHLTLSGVLARSSNVGTLLVGEQLSSEVLHSYFRKFGLGSPSGTGFPNESAGLLAPPAKWSSSQRYTVMFGQGMSVTALQATAVFQAIANRGVRIAPSIVAATSDGLGGWTTPAAPATYPVVSPETATQVVGMMRGVVSSDGTAPEARIAGYEVAGKTGTSERYNQELGRYSGKTASFIGFAPAQDPQLVVSVILQRPIRGVYGGQVAGPVFKDVMTYALQRTGVPPASTRPSNTYPHTFPPAAATSDSNILGLRREGR